MNEVFDVYGSETQAFRLGADRALVMINRAACFVTPYDGDSLGRAKDPGSVDALLSSEPVALGRVSLGDALVWASARFPLLEQRVFGAPFDRRVIREALQPFVQEGFRASDAIEVALVDHNGGRALAMRLGEIIAIAMSLRLDTETHGDDFPVTQEESSNG